MLTLKERLNVLVVLRYVSLYNWFPARVDVEEWRVRAGTGKMWKNCISRCWFALAILHSLYKSLNLLQVLMLVPATQLHQIVLHTTASVGSLTIAIWYYVMYVQYADDFAKFVSITLSGNIARGTKGRTSEVKISTTADWAILFEQGQQGAEMRFQLASETLTACSLCASVPCKT